MIKLFLAQERERLGLKAKDVAEFAGISIPTQSNYEQGKRMPDASYLAKISTLGFDIHYVLTGVRNTQKLTEQEERLLLGFRKAHKDVQNFIVACFNGCND